MRTAIVSDLHLGSDSCKDLLRDTEIRDVFLREIESADRLVLLGDVLELFERPLATVLNVARPFFEKLGKAMTGRQVVVVPGNHDYQLAEPLLEQAVREKRQLGLEQRIAPSGDAATRLAGWLAGTKLDFAYPGLWLRDDVYATHGHYMDCHRTLTRMECIAPAAMMRAIGSLPDHAKPGDYERVLRPLYRLGFSLAQLGIGRWVTRSLASAWRSMAGRNRSGASHPTVHALSSAGVWSLNRVLRASFHADFSGGAIYRSSFEGGTALVEQLKIDAAHTIMGHSHWGGPEADEANWTLPGGGRLHNTASWVFDPFLNTNISPGPSWPGTIVWLEDDGPPHHSRPLLECPHEELKAAVGRIESAARV